MLAWAPRVSFDNGVPIGSESSSSLFDWVSPPTPVLHSTHPPIEFEPCSEPQKMRMGPKEPRPLLPGSPSRGHAVPPPQDDRGSGICLQFDALSAASQASEDHRLLERRSPSLNYSQRRQTSSCFKCLEDTCIKYLRSLEESINAGMGCIMVIVLICLLSPPPPFVSR